MNQQGSNMLHYQLSPPKKEVKKTEESAAPSFLTLGAFSTVPKIHFEAVLLGQTKRRSLIVRNPNESACFLKILKKPPAAFKLSYGSDGQEDVPIPPADQVEIIIDWTPKEEGQCFEAFQLQGSNCGRSKLSVHLLGTCLPPAKKQGARRRPATVSVPGQPKASDPSLRISTVKGLPAKTPAKVTIPHSPNFSTRFSSRTSSARTSESNNIVASTPKFKTPAVAVDKAFISPNPLEKLSSIAFPFTPEAPKILTREVGGGDGLPEELQEDITLPIEPMDPQKTFLLSQEPSAVASPSRRETYLVSPAPNNMGQGISHLACNTAIPQIDSAVPPLEDLNGLQSEQQDTSTGGIELDPNILDSIAKALDDELGLKFVHRSDDRILDSVHDIGSEQQRKEIEAKFSRLTEISEENMMMSPLDLEDEDLQLGTKAASGEFLCMDQMDLVPNFPQDEVRVETELMASIKQMLKDGKTDEDIIAHFSESENMEKEIRALYDELRNKYKSCRECYEIAKAAHLCESFTFNRIVIQKAIKNNDIRLKPGVDICGFKSKTSIISSLLSSYNRPWLWSALCLVFHNDKLVADDIDIMNFIDDNLFWNNELMDGFDMEDGGSTPKEFLDLLVPKFLQNYLEIVYLLDATGIPSVFVPNNSTKKILDAFQSEYLEGGNLNETLSRIPIKLMEAVDPIHYLIQDNLRGPNLLASTNIIKLVQELTENSQDGPNLMCKSSSMESMKESVTAALQEVQKLGIQCELPAEDEGFDSILYGNFSGVDEKLVWQLVLRIRISQCKKLQGSEE